MKLTQTLIFCLLMLLFTPTLVYTQYVTLNIVEGEVKTALDSIKKQTQILYRDPYGILSKAKKVSLNVKQGRFYDVLQMLSKDQVFDLPVTKVITVTLKPEFESQLSSGVVVDQYGDAAADATIAYPYRGTSTVTTPNGYFFLNDIVPNTILEVYGPNIQSRTYKVGRHQRYIRIDVIKDITKFKTISSINTGYHQLTKLSNTSANFSVNMDFFQQRVPISIVQRLEGIVPALLPTNNNTAQNKPVFFSIGARTSLLNPNPLIILNNFPFEGNIDDINPDDIADITVLRDAMAVGLWGSRAANGVLVIQMKSAKYIDRFRVSFNTSISTAAAPNLFRDERINAHDRIFIDSSLYEAGFFNNFRRSRTPSFSPVAELFLKNITPTQRQASLDSLRTLDNRNDLKNHFYRRHFRHHFFIQCEGGTEKSNFYLSTGYDRINPELQKSWDERKTTLFNFNTKHKDFRLSVGVSLAQHTQHNMNGVPDILQPYEMLIGNNGNDVAIPYKYRSSYTDTIYPSTRLDWKYYPLREFRLRNNTLSQTDFRYDAALRYDAASIIPGLEIGAFFQQQIAHNQTREVHHEESFLSRDLVNSFAQIRPSGLFRPVPWGPITDRYNTTYNTTNFRLQFSYTKRWRNNHLIVMAGKDHIKRKEYFTRDRNYNNNSIDYSQHYPLFYAPGVPELIPNLKADRSIYHNYASGYVNSFFKWREKYELAVSSRWERSNLLGAGEMNAPNPLLSAGIAWHVSNERFYQCNWLPFLKLSVSYGSTGNPPYSTIAQPTVGNSGINVNGDPFSYLIDPPQYSLRWESVRNVNIGLYARTMNDRFELSINWYSKKAKDLVGYKKVDPTSGNYNVIGNVGAMSSRNLDLIIDSKNILRRFRWNTSFQLSVVSDKITHTEDTLLPAWQYCNPEYFTMAKGKPLYGLFSFAFRGLDNAGNPLGDKQTNYDTMVMANGSSNLVYGGRATPGIFGSITNAFSYKQFSLSVTLLYKLNYYFRRQSINYYDLFLGQTAGSPDFMRRWKQPGNESETTIPSMPDLKTLNLNRDVFYNHSTILIEKADHLRLQNIQLSYDLEGKALKKLRLRMSSLFLNCSNAGIIWRANKWKIDPDQLTGLRSTTVFTIGFKGTFK